MGVHFSPNSQTLKTFISTRQVVLLPVIDSLLSRIPYNGDRKKRTHRQRRRHWHRPRRRCAGSSYSGLEGVSQHGLDLFHLNGHWISIKQIVCWQFSSQGTRSWFEAATSWNDDWWALKFCHRAFARSCYMKSNAGGYIQRQKSAVKVNSKIQI